MKKSECIKSCIKYLTETGKGAEYKPYSGNRLPLNQVCQVLSSADNVCYVNCIDIRFLHGRLRGETMKKEKYELLKELVNFGRWVIDVKKGTVSGSKGSAQLEI